MNENILEFINISKSYFGVHALRNINLALKKGHILGLIGENGAGKSTLMNILGGVVLPDQGGMKLEGSDYAPRNPAAATEAGVAFIHQELNLFTNLSIADNIFIDRFPRISGLPFINRRKIHSKTRDLLKSVDLNLSPNILVEKLSPGERQLVEIAKALSTGARIIIFDEPTTSLTAQDTGRLFTLIEKLRTDGKSVIYISHTLSDVLRLADDIAVLRDGEVVVVGGKSEFSVNKMISRMVGREIEQFYPTRSTAPAEETVLQVKEVSQSGIVKDIEFDLHKGEILGLFGLMGSGRSELARIIFGLDPYEKGTVSIEGVCHSRRSPKNSIEQKMAFVTENRRDEGLLMDASIVDNIGLVSLPRYSRPTVPRLINREHLYNSVKALAGSLRIKSGPISRHQVKNLSGGNQQKVVIGKWLLSRPKVFIMDEPTRGIDVGAKQEVYSIINELASGGGGVLFISSELEELTGICNRILVMSNGEIQGCFRQSEFDEEQILRTAFREHTDQRYDRESHSGENAD